MAFHRTCNTAEQDTFSTSPTKDPLLCQLLDEMVECSMEQPYGCDKCPVFGDCLNWFLARLDTSHGYFTPEKLATCREKFAIIRASKNGNNGNRHK